MKRNQGLWQRHPQSVGLLEGGPFSQKCNWQTCEALSATGAEKSEVSLQVFFERGLVPNKKVATAQHGFKQPRGNLKRHEPKTVNILNRTAPESVNPSWRTGRHPSKVFDLTRPTSGVNPMFRLCCTSQTQNIDSFWRSHEFSPWLNPT